MNPNPMLGVVFHWLGGLASGSFYVPYRGVRKWSWETYWLVGGFFSWIIAPWVLAAVMTNDLIAVLQQQSMTTLWWSYFFGATWGLGGLTFGLTMRYLGMSLGMAIALGYCAAFGTLVPPIFNGTIGQTLATASGQIILLGVLVCLLGIGIAGLAGMNKEREMPEARKKASIKEFNFTKGILVGTFSGILSASFAYALAAAEPIAKASVEAGTDTIWSGLPKLVVDPVGRLFTSNFIWCVLLNFKNRSGYLNTSAAHVRPEHAGLTGRGRWRARCGGAGPGCTPADWCRSACADAGQLRLSAMAVMPHVVHAVLLLHHGRNPNGAIQVLQLDPAHGQHHHLQHAVGGRLARMAGKQQKNARADHGWHRRADSFHRDRWVRQQAGAGRVAGDCDRRTRAGVICPRRSRTGNRSRAESF